MTKPDLAPKRIGRICAVCGKRGGVTYGFKTALRNMGHPNWAADKAHPECVKKLANHPAPPPWVIT